MFRFQSDKNKLKDDGKRNNEGTTRKPVFQKIPLTVSRYVASMYVFGLLKNDFLGSRVKRSQSIKGPSGIRPSRKSIF